MLFFGDDLLTPPLALMTLAAVLMAARKVHPLPRWTTQLRVVAGLSLILAVIAAVRFETGWASSRAGYATFVWTFLAAVPLAADLWAAAVIVSVRRRRELRGTSGWLLKLWIASVGLQFLLLQPDVR